MDVKTLTLKAIGEQLTELKSAIDSIMKAHAAGAEVEAPEELEVVRGELLAELRARVIAVFVAMDLKLGEVQIRGEPTATPALTEEQLDTMTALFKAGGVERDAWDQLTSELHASVRSGAFQAHEALLRNPRGTVYGAIMVNTAQVELLTVAIEAAACDAPDEVKEEADDLLAQLIAVSPAAVRENTVLSIVDRSEAVKVELYEVDLIAAVKAIAVGSKTCAPEDRGPLTRLGVRLASELGRLQSRKVVAFGLADVAAAVEEVKKDRAALPLPMRLDTAPLPACMLDQHFTRIGALACECGKLKYSTPFVRNMLADGSPTDETPPAPATAKPDTDYPF